MIKDENPVFVVQTEQDFIRVNNDIAKAKSKKSRLAASLDAATEQLKSREEDMQDIRQHLEDTTEECKTTDEAILATTVSTGVTFEHLAEFVPKVHRYSY